MKVTYRANNSGGNWWLSDDDWKKLESAGWDVVWKESRWLGAPATEASKEFNSPADAIREFESITGQDASAEGCNCCGAPHEFSWDGFYVAGSECLNYLFENAPKSLREAAELLNKQP